jgi:hypothetical protein
VRGLIYREWETEVYSGVNGTQARVQRIACVGVYTPISLGTTCVGGVIGVLYAIELIN